VQQLSQTRAVEELTLCHQKLVFHLQAFGGMESEESRSCSGKNSLPNAMAHAIRPIAIAFIRSRSEID